MKSRTNKVLLSLFAVALLFSIGCDYASITAPEAIEAESTEIASPANDINSENDTLAKKGGKKGGSDGSEGSGSTSNGNKHDTRYGWGF